MVDDYVPDKVLDKIKKVIGIEHFDNNKILIDTDEKLIDNITSENVVILMTVLLKMIINFIPNYFYKKHYCKHKNWQHF